MKHAINRRGLAAIAMLTALSQPASAQFKATAEESEMCSATIYSRIVNGDPNWTHVHHFCDCVRFTNRAYYAVGKNTSKDIRWFLSEGMGGCNYVIGHTTPDFVLLPEIYLQKGIIFNLQEQDALAAAEFTKAINGNPRLPKAYALLAEFYTKANNKKLALETVTNGLQYNPENKALQRMYKKMGGVLPFPEPLIAVPIPQSAAPSSAVTPGDKAATDVPERQGIGTPTNPWCRFCADTPAAPAGSTPSTPGVIPKAAP